MEKLQAPKLALAPGEDAGKIIGPESQMNEFEPKRVEFDDLMEQKQEKEQSMGNAPRARDNRESRQISFIAAFKGEGTNSEEARQVFSSEMLKLPAFFCVILSLMFLFPIMLLITDNSVLNITSSIIYEIMAEILAFFYSSRELFLFDCYREQKIAILRGEIFTIIVLACCLTVFVLNLISLWSYSHNSYVMDVPSKRLVIASGFLMWVFPIGMITDTVERRMMIQSNGRVYYENVRGGNQIYKIDEYVLSCRYIRDEFDDYEEFSIETPEPVKDQYMLVGEENAL